MRKFSALVIGLAALALTAGAANAQGGPEDLAAGTGKVRIDTTSGRVDIQIHVNAHGGPVAGTATGNEFIKLTGPGASAFPGLLDARADVNCLNVIGNLALVGGVVTQSSDASLPVGSGLYINVVDNGSPGGGNDLVALFTTAVPLPACPAPSPFGTPIDSGNFVVKDVAP